jgi:hypothetical protein
LENLDNDDGGGSAGDEGYVDISRAWENISENMRASPIASLGYCDFKQRKPWFDEECSKLLGERK